MKRRALLVVSSGVAFAGCQSVLSTDEELLQLGVVEIINHVESSQDVEIEIFADDELVHETRVTLDAAEPNQPTGAFLDKNWPDEAYSYTLQIHSEIEEEPREERLDEPFAGSCENPLIVLRPERVETYKGTSGECYE